jgi:alkylation response protein AidB-like acyl-CoA dehydrogenase
MDFGFSQEEEALRQEAREFVRTEWTEKYGDEDRNLTELSVASYDHGTPAALAAQHEFIQKLVEKGWWTMAWPKEYGGQEASISTLFAFKLEMDLQGAPAAYAPLNAIHSHGTPWQKEFFLPKLARAEISIGLGLTEPNAGSDLASVETRAVKDGDEYVINGEKIFQSAIPLPDYYYLLVRTDPDLPKHKGLSLFILPTDAPGFTAQPIHDMMGLHRWHQEFFQDIRLTEQYRLGEENQGWYIIMSGLQQNRANMGMVGILQRAFNRMAESAKTHRVNGGVLAENPIARHGLADLRIETEVLKTVAFNALSESTSGDTTGRSAAMTRTWGGEMLQKVWQTYARLVGQPGTVVPRTGVPWAPLDGFAGVNGLLSYGMTIGEGSKEITRNIIAQRGLGLPRG